MFGIRTFYVLLALTVVSMSSAYAEQRRASGWFQGSG